MIAIAGSFHQLTIWRTIRDKQYELELFHDRITLKLAWLKHDTHRSWQAHSVTALGNQFIDAIQVLLKGYQNIMDWLGTQDSDEKGSWTSMDAHDKKLLVIKQLVVFHHYGTLLGDCFEHFGDRISEFKVLPVLRRGQQPKRTLSCSDIDQLPSAEAEDRCKYEVRLHAWLRSLKDLLTNGLKQTHKLYDTSDLFEEFVGDLQYRNSEEQERWHSEGMRYPYPDWKLKNPYDGRALFWSSRDTISNVPCWDEDEDLKKMFL